MASPFERERRSALLWLAALTAAAAALRFQICPAPLKGALDAVRDNGPNEIDLDTMTKNYYEGLLEMDREPTDRAGLIVQMASLFQAKEELPQVWSEQREPMAPGPASGFLFRENIPNFDGVYKGVRFRINRWSQRAEVDYSLEKPPGVFRIAVVGGSNTMGYGVDAPDSFPVRLEQRLNRELSPTTGLRYEVINFSSNGYHLPDKLYIADTRFAQFQPDLAMVDVLAFDLQTVGYDYLAWRFQDGRDLHFDFLKAIIEKSGARPDMPRVRLNQRLKPYKWELLDSGFRELKRIEGRLGCPVVVLVLNMDIRGVSDKLHWLVRSAEKHDLTALRIFDSINGGGMDMYVHPRDFHFSAKANHLVADEIYDKLMRVTHIAEHLKRPARGAGGSTP